MTTDSIPALDLHPATSADFDWLLGSGEIARPWSVAPDLAPAGVIEIVRTLPANWLIIAGDEVVGIIGLKTEAAGRAEIGYGVAASRERQGLASAAVAALLPVLNARQIVAVTAETSVDNTASQRVLDRNGFVRIGGRVDEEDGPVIVWERRV